MHGLKSKLEEFILYFKQILQVFSREFKLILSSIDGSLLSPTYLS